MSARGWLGMAWVVLAVSACTSTGVTDEPDAGGGTGTATCQLDDECGAGRRCLSGSCVTVSGCTSDAQCAGGRCVAGECEVATTCTSDEQCGADQRCVNGGCVPACTRHSECALDQHCEGGRCQPGASCTADVDCADGMICDATRGTCVAGCRPERGCSDGRVCVDTTCVDCGPGAACGNGLVCVNGRCDEGCASSDACTDGRVCRDQQCQPCQDSGECGAGRMCRNGACADLPPCVSDSQCTNTQVCRGGTCQDTPACSTTADCADPAFSCVFGTCTRNDTCSSHADCSPAQTCTDGRCRNTGACSLTADCPSTQHCEDGACIRNNACTTSSQCLASEECVAGTCRRNPSCNIDADCPSHQFCGEGVCTDNGPCARDRDCPASQACVNATCTRNPACVNAADCRASESCVEGACQRNPDCTRDDQCSASQACVAGTCTTNGSCMDHAACPASQYCLAGTCTQGPQCTADTECLSSERCALGRCIPNPSCTSDNQCPREQSCQAGTCTRNPGCSPTMACPSMQACLDGQCVQVRQCTRDADCADTTLCNGVETCDIAGGGVCRGGTPVVVGDGVSCTVDSCDPATGVVTHLPVDTACSDGNVCTVDACDVVLGCTNAADNAAVPAQAGSGDCRRQVCQAGVVMTVVDNADTPPSDGIGCTVEACTNGTPSVTANAAACQDGNACNGAERCVAGSGCQPASAPLNCTSNDACLVGFCDPVTGCGTTPLDADMDGYRPTSCGGTDCLDTDAQVHPGRAEVAADMKDNNCNGFTDEGFGSLSCPAAPTGLRILDPVTLAATISGVTPGAHSVRWTVVTQPAANSLALNGATTANVSFSPVVRGSYTLRVRLTQVGAADQVCDVSFDVAGPDEDFNAQLVMADGVDVDLHVLHPVGKATPSLATYFSEFNWGPPNAFSCQDASGTWSTCATEETRRTLPDCHFGNCAACTVVVPGQPACAAQSLAWNQDGAFPFVGGAAVSADANPKLDIDNRRGCYLDAQGVRVCTPENISIKRPSTRTGRYTVAVHYWGEPVRQDGTTWAGNGRGVAPAGLARITVDVEVFCRAVGFKRFRCRDLPVDGWCFVADATWSGGECSAVSAVTSNNSSTSRAFPNALLEGWDADNGIRFDTTPDWANVVATPLP